MRILRKRKQLDLFAEIKKPFSFILNLKNKPTNIIKKELKKLTEDQLFTVYQKLDYSVIVYRYRLPGEALKKLKKLLTITEEMIENKYKEELKY